jgi:Putative Ig domain
MRVRGHAMWVTLCIALAILSAGRLSAQIPQVDEQSRVRVEDTPLPNAAPRHAYRFEFHTRHGIPSFKWAVIDGDVPAGLRLSEDGVLSGSPLAAGVFHFTVQVTDTSRPPQTATRLVELRVVPPLLLEWRDDAKVTGNRIDGKVKVSNGTEDDFDLTFVVLAVAENGRATAIGYQRFVLKHGVTSFEIPFGETLPNGGYVVHVDTVAEVPEKDQIYRARLQTKERLQVVVGP